jgi:dephospho-CoA kinase
VGRVLITGMSGVGKSSALSVLDQRGFSVLDTDQPGWTRWSDASGGYVWEEDRISKLLARESGPSVRVRRGFKPRTVL